MPFRFNMLLTDAGIAPSEVRLLRHQPTVAGQSLLDIWRTDRPLFEQYQALQLNARRGEFSRPYWASFIGTWDGKTLFTGLYSVGSPERIDEAIISPISGIEHPADELDRFTVTADDAASEYAGKLFIDWGGGASGKRAWVQRAELQDKVITELHRDGTQRPFPGLMHLANPLSTLADAPSEWVQQLSAANGVYLLTCPRDGSLYVGSATAEGGFWSRWANYRMNGHGGNVAMIDRERSDYIVSVLQVAGSTDTYDDILAAERLWKRKLQTRELGLNRNS